MDAYRFNNVLVTGGAGFIGSNFIRYLLSEASETRVINLDKLTYAGSEQNLFNLPNTQAYSFIKGNICDRRLLDYIFEEFNIDTVVHFAAESHVDRSIVDPTLFIETNVNGTCQLLEAAYQYWTKQYSLSPHRCRFYHISTDEVFGSINIHDSPCSEEARYCPSSPYAASKASSDHLVRAFYTTYRLPIVMSYSTNNYGPHQHFEKFIPTVINCCIEEKDIPIYGNGKNVRDWLYVQDHCIAIFNILKYGLVGESYNIAAGNELSNIELAYMICNSMDEVSPRNIPYKSLVVYVQDRMGHDFRYALDTRKIRTTIGWKPRVDIASGLDRTIKFYLEKNNAYAEPDYRDL